MTLSLAIDLALAGLLVAAIACMAILLRRLEALRAGHTQFQTLAGQIGEAAMRAEAASAALRENAKAADATLGGQVARAVALRDELTFLVERGERVAEEIAAARNARPAAVASRPADPPRREERPLPAALAGLR